MIYTVTLNPSIDYVVHLDRLQPGEINRNEAEEFQFGGKINRLIEQNGPEFLEQEIGRLADGVLEQPVGVLYAKYEDKAKQLKERLVELYRFAVEQKLQEVLALVNVEQVVVEKINAFSAEELENLIFSVMKKELRAIVWLGALLGCIM